MKTWLYIFDVVPSFDFNIDALLVLSINAAQINIYSLPKLKPTL